MSGGSWDYLFLAADRSGGEGFLYRSTDIHRMADRLVELGYPAEAEELHDLAIRLDQARIELIARWEGAADLMKAVEWYDSGDYGKDTLRREIEQRRVGIPR